MGLRPGKCYRKKERPYTRKSKKKLKEDYVKGAPAPKIKKFEMGDKDKDFPLVFRLVAEKGVQIRHNALEAARISLNKNLEKELGKDGYFFKILVYPHHIIRENMLATGAGADRFQTGMRKSFGKPVGRAAQVKKNQDLIEVRVGENQEGLARKVLKICTSKLPTPCRIIKKKG